MKRKLHQFQKEYMKTDITLKVIQTNQSTVDIQESVQNAFNEFDRIVKKFTRFESTSELSNLNNHGGEWFSVSNEFFGLLQSMLQIAKETNGAFDPTIIDFLEVYGYDRNYDFSKLDNPNLNNFVEKIKNERPHWSEIQLNLKLTKVKLAKNQRVDLGGIGKGYAIDCAFNELIKVNTDFLIDAGGDVRSSGLNEINKLWQIGLKSTIGDKDTVIGSIELDNKALASSGSWARKVKNFHHLINPLTGKPSKNNYSTVFVLADTGLKADAWATACFIDSNLKVPKGFKVLRS